MPYFPMFVNLKGKHCLIVGGGLVALRKVEKLLPFEPVMTVVAPEFLEEFQVLEGILLCKRECRESDVNTQALVIAATDDRELNRSIYELCSEKNIPVNVVDDPELCTFFFPSLVNRGELSVGISTAGTSPTFAIKMRKQIESFLPDEEETWLEDVLDWLGSIRTTVKEKCGSQKLRMVIFERLLDACMEAKRPLEEKELNEIIDLVNGR